MANPFVKGWKYLMAAFGAKIDEHADPKIQIQQAIEDAQRQHAQLTQQAAAVIGNQRQLEMKLARQMTEVEKLQSSARQALVLADQRRAAGDEAGAQQYEQTAQAFATQLVSAEQSMEDLKGLHDSALQAAEQAKKAVENNAMTVQSKLAERTQLLSQLEQAKMQEQVSASLQSMSALSAPGNTPSLAEVREKIEGRYARALGLGRAGLQQRRGPDARGAEVDPGHGRRLAPGPDPQQHGRQPALRPAVRVRAAAVQGHAGRRGRRERRGHDCVLGAVRRPAERPGLPGRALGRGGRRPALAARAPVGEPGVRRPALLGRLHPRAAPPARPARPLEHPVLLAAAQRAGRASARGGRGWPASAAGSVVTSAGRSGTSADRGPRA